MSRWGDEVERQIRDEQRRKHATHDLGSLFAAVKPDEEARARGSDPQTSHEAAEKVSGEGVRQSQIDVLHTLRSQGPMTDERLLDAMEFRGARSSPSRVRTARKELMEAGLVEECGEGMTKRGNRAAMHRITAKGFAFLQARGGA